MRAIISAEDRDHFESITDQLSKHLLLADVTPPTPNPTQVRIRVSATAVNPADVLQSKGAYPAPKGASRVLGLECVGVIDEVGERVSSLPDSSWIHEGVAACALLEGGAYADYAVVDARQVLPLPTFPDTSTPEIFALGAVESAAASWMLLENVGRLASEPGRSALIHGASGGVGSIGVQLAKAWGNRVYATTGSRERCEKVEALDADKCFDYHQAWPDALTEVEPKGVDFIFDVLGAGGLAPNLAALANYGHIGILGFLQGQKGEINLGALLRKNGSITAQTLRSQTPQRKATIVSHLRNEVWPLLESGAIKPVIGKVLPFEEMATAHALLGNHADEDVFGKVVVTL